VVIKLLLRKKTDANEAAAPRELEGISFELRTSAYCSLCECQIIPRAKRS
jgi:hypothetical protein